MSKYIAYRRPTDGQIEVIKQGFSWMALLFTSLWLLNRKLYFRAIAYIILSFALFRLLNSVGKGLPEILTGAALLVVAVAPAVYGNGWWEARLKRKGWQRVSTGREMLTITQRDTPGTLIGAAWNGDLLKVAQLIRNGHNVDSTNSEGYTALDAALTSGDRATIEMLLLKGASAGLPP